MTLAEMERKFITDCLDRHNWDMKAAAKELGVCFKTLYNKLHSWEKQDEEMKKAVDGNTFG